MANYESTMRTNYFKVKDEEKFKALMDTVSAVDMHLFEDTTSDGAKLFGFGCYGCISGVPMDTDGNYVEVSVDNNDDYDYDYDVFLVELQKHVAEDDAIIITEAGYEKLRYVNGSSIVITSKEIKYLDITNLAFIEAKKMLNNEKWETQTEY